MSKTKNKTHNELEHLRGVVKRLKAQVKYYKRRAHIKDEPVFDKEPEPDCPACGKGHLRKIDLLHVLFNICDLCGHRERVKND